MPGSSGAGLPVSLTASARVIVVVEQAQMRAAAAGPAPGGDVRCASGASLSGDENVPSIATTPARRSARARSRVRGRRRRRHDLARLEPRQQPVRAVTCHARVMGDEQQGLPGVSADSADDPQSISPVAWLSTVARVGSSAEHEQLRVDQRHSRSSPPAVVDRRTAGQRGVRHDHATAAAVERVALNRVRTARMLTIGDASPRASRREARHSRPR